MNSNSKTNTDSINKGVKRTGTCADTNAHGTDTTTTKQCNNSNKPCVDNPNTDVQGIIVETHYVEEIVRQYGSDRHKLIQLLQLIQGHYRYLPQQALQRLADITNISPADIESVSSFYDQFRHEPVGQYIIHICKGTACHVKGANLVYDAICRHLGLPDGADTDINRIFTVQKVACLGCCTLAPVMQIENTTYGHLTPSVIGDVINDFLEAQRHKSTNLATDRQAHSPVPIAISDNNIAEIRLGLGSCCMARGSDLVYKAFEEQIRKLNIPIKINKVGCVGMCHQTPLAEIVQTDGKSYFYARILPEDARGIILRHFKPRSLRHKIKAVFNNSIDKILTDAAWQSARKNSLNLNDQPATAFLDRQKHIATEYFGQIDPVDLQQYLEHHGFTAARLALNKLTPDEIIAKIKNSQLKGRGGAGFPTARKWQTVKNANNQPKYIICNGDEGDPGAFMDRMLLESFPYRIIEGMIVAAYAVGAHKGYFYIRSEYPLALERINNALKLCRQNNLLGKNILGSNFDLELSIVQGAGAFVCGEETALIASVEGKRGMPRLRPPYPAVHGLWGKPTLVNNVETYALVPWIIRNGPNAFANLGSQKSKGTKVFALAGKVARGGLIEVPMGITLYDIVNNIGGGVANGKRFKAVQIGGPSGGCVPASLSYISVDYEALTQVGAIMGSGGLVVLDETDCMVDIARYFLEFTQDQSCGKCTYCRIGTRRMLDILENLCAGRARRNDLQELAYLAKIVQEGSICGLGRTAPNPVLSTLRYFRDEYEAHLEKRCPAGKCRSLINYEVTDNCIGCTLCARNCPVAAIEFTPHEKHSINTDICVRCGTCKGICPVGAITITTPAHHSNPDSNTV